MGGKISTLILRYKDLEKQIRFWYRVGMVFSINYNLNIYLYLYFGTFFLIHCILALNITYCKKYYKK